MRTTDNTDSKASGAASKEAAARSSTVRIHPTAKAKLAEIAANHDTTPAKYLEALLHYAISQHERPGSWEAEGAFNFWQYDERNEHAHTDKWF